MVLSDWFREKEEEPKTHEEQLKEVLSELEALDKRANNLKDESRVQANIDSDKARKMLRSLRLELDNQVLPKINALKVERDELLSKIEGGTSQR